MRQNSPKVSIYGSKTKQRSGSVSEEKEVSLLSWSFWTHIYLRSSERIFRIGKKNPYFKAIQSVQGIKNTLYCIKKIEIEIQKKWISKKLYLLASKIKNIFRETTDTFTCTFPCLLSFADLMIWVVEPVPHIGQPSHPSWSERWNQNHILDNWSRENSPRADSWVGGISIFSSTSLGHSLI